MLSEKVASFLRSFMHWVFVDHNHEISTTRFTSQQSLATNFLVGEDSFYLLEDEIADLI